VTDSAQLLSQTGTDETILIGLAKVGMVLMSQSWHDAYQHGLTPTQGQVLTLLLNDGQLGLRLSEVAKPLGITAAAASDAVTALVDKGLAQKVRSPQDGRAIVITLTETGIQVAQHTAGWADFLLGAVDELLPDEQAVLLRGLSKLIRRLQEHEHLSARMCVTCRFFQPNRHMNQTAPHHCAFVDVAFGDRQLRLDCHDHAPAKLETAQENWQQFINVTHESANHVVE
jgi:DNA-binding MarR family transcriptional regulator